MDNTFVYKPLKDGEIRLLQIQWSVDEEGHLVHPAANGVILCNITHHRLDAGQNYTALSYTWGDDKPESDLLVGDKCIKIRQNLYAFLAQARPDAMLGSAQSSSADSKSLTREVGLLWIDAVCINQGDKAEKASQIAQMASIYASASRIVIWLGRADALSDVAMDFYRSTTMLWATKQLRDQRMPVTDAECAAVESLTRRSYWYRSWVYQEATTPRVPREFWCGGKIASFDVVCVANALAHQHMLALGLVLEPSPWNRKVTLLNELSDRRRNADRSVTFLSLLHQTMGLEATDPRDKIYALLHIYRDIQRMTGSELPVQPDPDMAVEDVFQAAAVFILETTRQLDLLLFCSIGQYRKLRSWVPNFYNFIYTILGYTYREFFSAGGQNVSRFSISKDRGRLSVGGIRVDTVQAVHKAMIGPTQRGEHTNNSAFWEPIFSRWTRSLAEFLFPKPACDRAYVAGGTVCAAIDWVLAVGMSPGYGTLTRDADISHWRLLELAASPTEPDIPASGGAFHDLVLRTCRQSVFRTAQGYLGFGDADVCAGDVLAVLPGLEIPMLLRPVSASAGTDSGLWRVVGPCLVKGIMDGEAISPEHEEEDFVLI